VPARPRGAHLSGIPAISIGTVLGVVASKDSHKETHMLTARNLLIVSLGAALAASAHAEAVPSDVNVVNVVDTNVVNIPDARVINTVQTEAEAREDLTIVIASKESIPLNNSLITDVTFNNLVTDADDRLIVDFVSVESYVAPNQKSWATLLPCTERTNSGGRIAVPLQFGGSVYNGDTKVNDGFLANIAMHTYIDSGCTTVLRVYRGQTPGLGHANVTIQAHRIKRPIIIIGR
jgi:hypothetical protein